MMTQNLLKEVYIARLHYLRKGTHFDSVMSVERFMEANADIIKQINESILADYSIHMKQHTFVIRDAIKLYLFAEGIKLK